MKPTFLKANSIPILFLVMAPFLFSSASTANSASEVHENDATSEICRMTPVVEEQENHENYKVTIFSAGDGDCHFIEIEKDGVLLYHDEGIGAHFYFGSDLEKEANPFLRITGKYSLNLVFSKWTGGMHCCYSLHIFDLTDGFQKIADLDGGNFSPELRDLDFDGIPEIEIRDDFLAYRFSSFADSATGRVVMKYEGSDYRIADEYMREPAPDSDSLAVKIEPWRRSLGKRKDLDNLPQSFMQAVTDLVFSGNKQAAFELVDRVWPADFPGKVTFLASYDDALHESKYYRMFER